MTQRLCDTSVWVAMSVEHHVHGALVANWFETITDDDGVLFCRSTQQSFLRLMTTNSVFAPYGGSALSGEQAWEVFGRLSSDSRVGLLRDEPTGLDAIWRQFTLRPQSSPKLWMDAYLAAFAVAAGLRLVTTDAAFRQFPGLDLLLLGATH